MRNNTVAEPERSVHGRYDSMQTRCLIRTISSEEARLNRVELASTYTHGKYSWSIVVIGADVAGRRGKSSCDLPSDSGRKHENGWLCDGSWYWNRLERSSSGVAAPLLTEKKQISALISELGVHGRPEDARTLHDPFNDPLRCNILNR